MKNTENMIRRIVAVLLTLVLFFSASAQTFIPSSAATRKGRQRRRSGRREIMPA